jgi:hypothetical protein
MNTGTRLALQAVIQGLRSSGAIGAGALAVIVDELRYASREAEEHLLCTESRQIDRLAHDLADGLGFECLRDVNGQTRLGSDRADRSSKMPT